MPQTLTVSVNHDYSATTFSPEIDAIQFNNIIGTEVKAIFAASQFDLGYIQPNMVISGSFGSNVLVFKVAADGIFDTGFTFLDWQADDHIDINGAGGGEELHGTDAVDTIRGFAGDDVIYTSSGEDRLFGGAGNDVFRVLYDPGGIIASIDGGAGRDTIMADFSDLLLAAITNIETAVISEAAYFRADQIGGGGKINTLVHSSISGSPSAAVWVIGETIDLSSVTIRGAVIPHLGSMGTAFTAIGSSHADYFFANAGADELHGGEGRDVFFHTSGNDACYGGGGNDLFDLGNFWVPGVGGVFDGGTGDRDKLAVWLTSPIDLSLSTVTSIEILKYVPGPEAAMPLTLGSHQIGAGPATIMRVIGSAGDDTLRVTGNAVDLAGLDLVNWDNGADRVEITGTSGADTLIGSAAADYFSGGDGADTFVFGRWRAVQNGAIADYIEDFQQGSDLIDLSRIDADSGGMAGNGAFKLISGAFTGLAGELRAVAGDGITTIEGDINGDGNADFQIVLTSALSLNTADFIL